MARQFRFVVVSNPTEAPSSESKKLAYSHAFRQAHAQRRRKQIENHRKAAATSPSPAVGKTFTAPEEAALARLNHVLNNNQDPFSSLARPLSSMEYFLLNHCMSIIIVIHLLPVYRKKTHVDVNTLDPSNLLADVPLVIDVHVIVPFIVGHCDLFNRPGDQRTQMLRDWVGLAVADDTLMIAAVLLSTCRHILQAQPGNLLIVRMALQYKQTCLRQLRQEMSNTSAPVSVTTIAKCLALVLDEVMSLWNPEHDWAAAAPESGD